MRIDPEAVYLELAPGVTLMDFKTGDTRHAAAVILHWKDGHKWQRRNFLASENMGDTLGAILTSIGAWLDAQGSLDDALNTITTTPIERKATA